MEYNIIYKKRRSIKVSLGQDGLTVTAPPKASAGDIERVLELFKNKHKNYKALISFSQNPQHFFIGGVKTTAAQAGLADLSYKSLEKVFSVYKEKYAARTAEICGACGFKIKSLRFGKYRSKWGSMDSFGNMKLNKLIFILDSSLSDYLILHELCHLKQMNHSPKFWAEVEKNQPDYKLRRKRLKELGYLLKIFS